MACAKILLEHVPGVMISLCSVDTPAGGLVRVAVVDTDGCSTIYLDDSYTAGTAVVDLETKFRWKFGDKATRGPAPFKAARPAGLWDTRVSEMVPAVAAALGLATATALVPGGAGTFDDIVAEIGPLLKATRAAAPAGSIDDPAAKSRLLTSCLPAELRAGVRTKAVPAAIALAEKTVADDVAACNAVKALLGVNQPSAGPIL